MASGLFFHERCVCSLACEGHSSWSRPAWINELTQDKKKNVCEFTHNLVLISESAFTKEFAQGKRSHTSEKSARLRANSLAFYPLYISKCTPTPERYPATLGELFDAVGPEMNRIWRLAEMAFSTSGTLMLRTFDENKWNSDSEVLKITDSGLMQASSSLLFDDCAVN